jgi:4-hydroxy-3-methylbut-2-enyl diphosphate reductase IspH
MLLIGHSHHPEVVGTLGQLPQEAVTLIETAGDAATFTPKDRNSPSSPRRRCRSTTPPKSSRC